MSSEKVEESIFENVLNEIIRWAGIVEKTAENILSTQPEKKNADK